MKKLLLTLMLVVVSSSAMAEWVELVSTDRAKFYVKPDSIRKPLNTVKMWTLADLNEAKKWENGKTYRSFIDLFEYWCEERESRSTYQVLYSENMGKGYKVHIFDEISKWTPVIPDSINEKHLEFAYKNHNR